MFSCQGAMLLRFLRFSTFQGSDHLFHGGGNTLFFKLKVLAGGPQGSLLQWVLGFFYRVLGMDILNYTFFPLSSQTTISSHDLNCMYIFKFVCYTSNSAQRDGG